MGALPITDGVIVYQLGSMVSNIELRSRKLHKQVDTRKQPPIDLRREKEQAQPQLLKAVGNNGKLMVSERTGTKERT